MKLNIRKVPLFLAALTTILILNGLTVYAAGTVEITADPQTAAVGDTVKVTYTATGEGDEAVPPQIEITYDPNRLAFVDCDVTYGGGGGGLILVTEETGNINFSVLSGGTAEVAASAIFDGDGSQPALGTVAIAVDGEDTAAALEEPVETSSTGIEADTIVSTDGTKIISTVFADEFMPPLFHKETTTYNGQAVETAVFDMGNMSLLYVTDTTGENGNFSIYNSQTGELEDFKMLQSIENRFIIILKAPEDVVVPDGFTKASLQWDGLTLEAYAVNNIDNSVITDVSGSDFFLLYAMSSEGNKGWYLYDQYGGTYQRYLPIVSKAAGDEDAGFFDKLLGNDNEDAKYEYEAVAKRRLIIILIMAAVMIAMFVILLNFFLKLRDYQSYDYIDEDANPPMPPARREPSIDETSRIRANELARMEMGESFEPVDLGKLVNDPNGDPNGGMPMGAPKPVRPVYEDGELENGEFEDDEEDVGLFGMKKNKGKDKEKKKKKNMDFDEPQNIDWSSLEATVKDTNDARRPKGGDSPYVKTPSQNPSNINTEAKKTAGAMAAAVGATGAAVGTAAASAGAMAGTAAGAVRTAGATSGKIPAAGAPIKSLQQDKGQRAPQSSQEGSAAKVAQNSRPAAGANFKNRPQQNTQSQNLEEHMIQAKDQLNKLNDQVKSQPGDQLNKLNDQVKNQPKEHTLTVRNKFEAQSNEVVNQAPSVTEPSTGSIKVSEKLREETAAPVKQSEPSLLKDGEKKAMDVPVAESNVSVPTVDTPVKVDLPTPPQKQETKAIKPASQTYKETVPQQESDYWAQSSKQQYEEAPKQESEYDENGNFRPKNKKANASTGYDQYSNQAYGNQDYSQYSQQGYDQYGSQSYATQGYDQYNQGYDQYNQGYTGPIYANQGYDQYNQGYTGPIYTQGYDQYNQGYGTQNGYGGQGYDPYNQYNNQYNQYNNQYGYGYQQPVYNTQNIDLDDDFEFEFIDINRQQ